MKHWARSSKIKHTKRTSPDFKVRFQYATRTGAKLLAYGLGAVQEIFVVTGDAKALKRRLPIKLRRHTDILPFTLTGGWIRKNSNNK